MNKNIIKEIIYVLLAILIGSLVIKFVIWLLPFILIGIVSYMIYKSIKKNKNVDINSDSMQNTKGKKMKVIHDLDDEDK